MLVPYEKAEGMAKTREIIKDLKGKKSVGIFIGPEGGFDETEIEEAIAAGKAALGDKLTGNIIKEIYVPGRIVNIVAK